MKPIQLLVTSTLAVAFSSCAAHRAESYDTPGANAPADASQLNTPIEPASNPVYDTPAAYEADSGTATPPPYASPNIPAPSVAAAAPQRPPVSPTSSNGAATIHTVVAGDTLSGISAKYKVPAAAIKQANNMTKDTVILGRKMVIPPP